MKTQLRFFSALFIILIISAGQTAFGKTTIRDGKITGKVTDKVTGQPIPGVTITIPDLKIATSTDTNGIYVLKRLPKGEYLIQVSAMGYASETKIVDLGNTYSVDFKLSASNYELSDVVVTALGNTTTRKRATIPITIVTNKMIREGVANTAIDLVSSLPGVNATTEGSGTSKPQINGLGFDRVLTLMDGVPQEDFQWGDDHGILIDPYAVHDAEIIRGPASLQYGASAEAGVISFKSAPLPDNGTVLGSILTEYHTNNGYLGTSLNLAGNNNGFVWGLQASGEEAHSYSNPKDGYVWGTAWNQVNARLVLGINRTWGYSRLTLSALHRRIELPDGNRDSTGRFMFDSPQNGKIYPTRSDFLSYNANIASDKSLGEYQAWWQNSINVGKGRLGLDLGFTRSVHHDIDTGSVGSGNLLVNDIPFSFKYQLAGDSSQLKLTTGINGLYEFQHNGAAPPAPYVPDYEIPNYTNFEIGSYVIVEKNYKNLTLSGGLRFDRTNFIGDPMSLNDAGNIVPTGAPGSTVQFIGFNNTYSGLSGSIGASYQLLDNNYVKLNISKSYRAPAINELTSNGLNIGSNLVEVGNIHLKAEQGYQLDLAYGYDGKDVSVEADGFYNHINNFIFADRTDALSDGFPIYQYLSTNTAIIEGISGFLNIHPATAKWLELDNGFTYIYSHIPNASDSTQHLPYIPAPHLNSEIKLRLNDRHNSILKGTYLKFGLQHDWAQNNVYSAFYTELPSAQYTLFNAGLGTNFVNPKTGRTLCSLYVNCTNLTNVAYADHLNLAQYFLAYNGTPATVTRQSQGIYNMGRNISFKLIFPFGGNTNKTVSAE
ncbi:iron complex outermembrane receptor protein [Mucilaginibacter frigoritolerans]|uniref:Iron complex outermembrane receptor protein n=1 Tax=Mucilaginibacter frigoritolerans TaxID=652788 RepID=A0A562TMQ7_9SPHI|nr:TonB-dependent receptor [Mucilaginibacter frigoritolerans]TWI94812.1 iron complex outermembrane receptor protein [Mucilaginibacter frigoritolerans]